MSATSTRVPRVPIRAPRPAGRRRPGAGCTSAPVTEFMGPSSGAPTAPRRGRRRFSPPSRWISPVCSPARSSTPGLVHREGSRPGLRPSVRGPRHTPAEGADCARSKSHRATQSAGTRVSAPPPTSWLWRQVGPLSFRLRVFCLRGRRVPTIQLAGERIRFDGGLHTVLPPVPARDAPAVADHVGHRLPRLLA